MALIAVVAVASHSLALFITGLSMKFLQFGTLLNGMVFLPMLAVCGAVVPVGVWPRWVQQLSVFLPLTHGLAGVREIFDGAPPGILLAAAGRELMVGAGWLILAVLAFRLFIERARRTGQLDYAE